MRAEGRENSRNHRLWLRADIAVGQFSTGMDISDPLVGSSRNILRSFDSRRRRFRNARRLNADLSQDQSIAVWQQF
jgi:hypothetical protein